MKLSLLLSFALTLTLNAAEKIIIKGSDTLGAKMVPQLTEVYKKKHPHLEFAIAAEGSSSCFTNLLTNTCDFGMSSRKIKESERQKFITKGIHLTEHVAATDIIAVVINKNSPVNELSRDDIKAIFTGTKNQWSDFNWEDGPAIKVFTRNTSSGTYKTFQKLAMDKKEYARNSQKMAGWEQIYVEVSKNLGGICYVGLAYANHKSIKPLKIDGETPSRENAINYPLSRNLYFYSSPHTSKEALAFIEWVKTSKYAAKVIEKVGFVAVP